MQTIFTDIQEYIEISVFEISHVDCISLINSFEIGTKSYNMYFYVIKH